ncbi:uncharacterized protein LOC107046287 isoform X2 [Diachasma alloeum]|uniref:uncharacterized protein LOC107046287 isoform X2 n=1 Tax=Diachasma alloeum TaxID=454923 RepID=UPI0007384A4E|nr:uncharacterized protein LOC107046287 isoform X2 [Diachasma alloeum]
MREVKVELNPVAANGGVLGGGDEMVVKKEEEEVQEQKGQGGEVIEGGVQGDEMETGEGAAQAAALMEDQGEDKIHTLAVAEQAEQREKGEDGGHHLDVVEQVEKFGDDADSEIHRVIYREIHELLRWVGKLERIFCHP